MTQRVHYLSFYLEPGVADQRHSVPAGFAKVEYVAQVAADAGWDVRLVSTAMAQRGYAAGVRNGRVTYLPSWRPRGRVGFAVAILLLWAQIVRYLLFTVKQGDTVLAYHSLNYVAPILAARRVKRFRLVLEFNDLYSAVAPQHASSRSREEAFIRSADAHLFMNVLAARAFSDGQPHAVSYGSYVVPDRRTPQADDGRTHIVYAGIIEPGRRAAELAVRSATHLDESFVVHVLGFGTEPDVAALRELVATVNSEADREAVIFHGTLRGQEFTDFLHGCHVGLSTHAYAPDERESADFTFPSKIPQYMAHDLRVVSPDIACVVDSPFADFTTFYTDHAPGAIAGAVRRSVNAASDTRSPAALMAELDAAFERDLPEVLRP